jgi:hypothetical protein
MSKLASATGSVVILDILQENSMITWELVMEFTARTGNSDAWGWCLQQRRRDGNRLVHSDQVAMKYAATALVSGHSQLCIQLLRQLPKITTYFIDEARRQASNENWPSIYELLKGFELSGTKVDIKDV